MASIEVVNISQKNPADPIEINLTTSNLFYRGPAGQPGRDGQDGAPGRDGQDGAPGRDGTTPVKGVDYFTQQEINEFIAQVPAPDLSSYATKAEVETAIRGAESGLLKRAVVQSLPVQNIDDNTIYMVPKQGETGDVYDEYLYISNAWEHIGNTDIDLSDYATIAMLSNYLTAADVADCVRYLNLPSTSITEAINNQFYSLWQWFGSHTNQAIYSEHTNNDYYYIFNYFPYDIYIDGHKVHQISYEIDDVPNSDATYCNLIFYVILNGVRNIDITQYTTYTWEYNTSLTINTSLTVHTYYYDATSFRVNASRLNGQISATGMTSVDLPTAFKYIYDNYVRKSELSQELSSNDIQTIWNNSGSQQGE